MTFIYLNMEILNNLKNTRRNDTTLIINATDSTNDREIEIDELSRKRNIFSNDLNRIRKHKNNLNLYWKNIVVIVIRQIVD